MLRDHRGIVRHDKLFAQQRGGEGRKTGCSALTVALHILSLASRSEASLVGRRAVDTYNDESTVFVPTEALKSD